MLSKVWDEITYPFPNFNSDIDLGVSEYSAFAIETVKHWSDKVIAYLSSYPGYFPEPHKKSMGLLEISNLTWRVWYWFPSADFCGKSWKLYGHWSRKGLWQTFKTTSGLAQNGTNKDLPFELNVSRGFESHLNGHQRHHSKQRKGECWKGWVLERWVLIRSSFVMSMMLVDQIF